MKEIKGYKSLEALPDGAKVMIQPPPEFLVKCQTLDGHPCIGERHRTEVAFDVAGIKDHRADGWRFYVIE